MYQNYFKRLFDIILSLVIFFIVLPLMSIIFFSIWITIGFPIFSQKRPGLNGKIFTLYKFKTLFDLSKNISENERQSRLGNFLRKTGLDELPQLYNILKGDMSFVGPRPAIFNQDDLITLRTEKGVHDLVPGLTGWAQINGRDELPIPQKVALDKEYFQKQSFCFDIKILWLTFLKVLHRDGVSH